LGSEEPRELDGKPFLHRVEFRGRLFWRDSRFETTKRHKVEVAYWRQLLGPQCERLPDLWLILHDRERVQGAHFRKVKTGRKDAHDVVRYAINRKDTTHEPRVGRVASSP